MGINYPAKVILANLPTKIEKLPEFDAALADFPIYIKRDDLTECGMSGNKIRKLEYTLAEARKNGCDTLITCGGIQSNHCRATALAAVKSGMKAILLLRGEEEGLPEGNLFLDRLVGAEIRFVTPDEYRQSRMEIMEGIASELQKSGRKGMVIPEGASDEIGTWGYIEAIDEIYKQVNGLSLKIERIVVPVGSGGTYAGLLIGAKLLGWDIPIYGINVCDDADYFITRISEIISAWEKRYHKSETGLTRDDIKIIDGYVGRGYALAQPEEIEFYKLVASRTATILDPVYTGKTLFGLVDQLKAGTFNKGSGTLFIHTGGIFGIFPQNQEFFSEIWNI